MTENKYNAILDITFETTISANKINCMYKFKLDAHFFVLLINTKLTIIYNFIPFEL